MSTPTKMRQVVLSNKAPYSYQCPWDGRTRYRGTLDAPIGFDTETEMIDQSVEYCVPRLALASASQGTRQCLLHPGQVASFILLHRDQHFVAQNAKFDYWVLVHHFRAEGTEQALQAAKAWQDLTGRGQLHDTLILDQLIRLGAGIGWGAYRGQDDSITKQNLGAIADQYCGLEVDKTDPFRTRYAELIGRDWADPTIEEGFWSYAIKDAIVTQAVYRAQVLVAKSLLRKARQRYPKDLPPGTEKEYGYLTEALQTRASIVLDDIGRRGVMVDREKAAGIEQHLREELVSSISTMRKLAPQVFIYRDQCTPRGGISRSKASLAKVPPPDAEREVMLTPKGRTPRLQKGPLREVLEKIAKDLGVRAPQATGKKPGTSLSEKAWADLAASSGHPFLRAWTESVPLAKHIGFFELFRHNPILNTHYNTLMKTGRTSCIARGTPIEAVRDVSAYPKGIPIEEIKPGDLVYAYDDNLQLCLRKVLWAGKTGTRSVVRLHWQGSGHRTTGYVDLTPDHHVRLAARPGHWVAAEELCPGEKLLAFSRGLSTAHKVLYVEELPGEVDVYDLEIEGVHNFIAGEICVHNSYRPNLQQCASGDTEILTVKGWARFDAVDMESESSPLVAQFEPKTGEISFVEPEGWVCQKWPDPLISIQNDHIDLVLTADHNCLLRHRKDGDRFEIFAAEDYPEDYEQLHAGRYKGGKGLDLSDAELALVLAFQADGAWGTVKYSMDFSFGLDRKVKRLQGLLDAAGAKYTLKPKSKKGQYRFLVQPGPLGKKLYALLGSKKHLGPWLLDLSREQIDVFCEEVWLWDATADRATAYSSHERCNADWVQVLLTLSGRRAQVRVYDKETSKANADNYQVDHTEDADASSTTNTELKSVPCDGGKVYCVTVPTGFIVLRRGGKVSVTGNCPRDKDFRSLFVPRPGYKLFTGDFSYVELRTLAVVCERRFGFSKLGDTIRAGVDPHEYTASMIRSVSHEEFRSWKKGTPEQQVQYKADRQAAKACFHPDVEVLTPSGWKAVSSLVADDSVAQYWPGPGSLEFVKPYALTRREGRSLLRLRNESMDLRVTPDHRMLGYRHSGLPVVCFPEEMKECMAGWWNAGCLLTDGRFHSLSDRDVRQAVCIQADGRIRCGSVDFCFKKQRKVDRFRGLFPGATERPDPAYSRTWFKIPWRPLFSRILDDNKRFKVEELLAMPEALRLAFLDELEHWDSHSGEPGKRFRYSSIHKQNVDAVQAVAAVTGYKSTVKCVGGRSGHYDCYTVSVKKRDYAKGTSTLSVKALPGLHTVHCLSVPSSFLLVRDGGVTALVGNCNFGVPGGLGAQKLSQYAKATYNVSLDPEEAWELRRKLIHDIYPELALYLSDTSLANMAWTLGIPERKTREAFGLRPDAEPDEVQRMLRAVSKVLRGNPFKSDGTPYNERFVGRVWHAVGALSRCTKGLPLRLKEDARNKVPSRQLDQAFLGGPSLVPTGRLRGNCSYTQQRNCLDAETEALTQRGWVRGFDLTMEDVLLTKNAETGGLEWQSPTDLKFYPDYEGPLVEFESSTFSAVSTPDHRWLVYDKSTGKDICKTTDALSRYGDHRIHRTGVYQGPEGATHSDDFVRFCGWFLTDGNLTRIPRKRVGPYPVVKLYQSQRANPEKVAKIQGIVDRLDAVSSRREDRRSDSLIWTARPPVARVLSEMFPRRILTTEFLLTLTRLQAQLLVETMLDGDGTRSGGKEILTCRCKERADMFQMLCTLAGKASKAVWRDMSKYSPRSDKLKNIPKMNGVWLVRVLQRDKAQVVASQRREFVDKRPIWCPMVPNTYFVARRRNRVYISGNTPFQGLAADGAKVAMWELMARGYRVLAFVHDELVLELPEATADQDARDVERIMNEGMEKVLQLLPSACEYHVGDCWQKA